MLKLSQMLTATQLIVSKPLFRSTKEVAVFSRWQYLKNVLERDKPAGRKRPRLEAEYEALGRMVLGIAIPISGSRSALTALTEGEHQIVRRAEQWFVKNSYKELRSLKDKKTN